MSTNRIMSLVGLVLGVALGYVAVRGLLSSPPINANETAQEQNEVMFDDTCSADSPDVATCAMPEEISRADYFRLISPSSSFDSTTIVDQTIRNNRAELKSPETIPILPHASTEPTKLSE